MKLDSKRDHSKVKSSTIKGETTRDKPDLLKANHTIASANSKSQKTLGGGVPQNFNSFRHVITNSTTGDDVSWIVHLRDVKKPTGKPQATVQQLFSCGETKTESITNRKTPCDYSIRENSHYVVEVEPGRSLAKEKAHRRDSQLCAGTYYKENTKKKVQELERKFRNIPAKPKSSEFPEFLVEYKQEKKIKKELKEKHAELSTAKDLPAKTTLLRKLPKLHYSALDGHQNNLQYDQLEKQNQCKKNINQTYHLHIKEGHLPTVAWESSLRENPSKKKGKKDEEDEKGGKTDH